ncbi:MAG: radical SAM protein [Anaerolineae bacterium]|nr:radical SAM protein [Anaerolineae bacterium]
MGDCACHAADLNLRWDGEGLAFAFLELTPACNNRCVGCSNIFAERRIAAPLNGELWCSLIDRLSPHVRWLKLTGGEPTLHPDFAQIVAHLNHRGIPFRLLTNGRWLDVDATLNLLLATPVLESLLISLHGPDARSHEAFTVVAGSFADAVETIRRAAAAGLLVASSTVITRHNWDRVEELVEFALSLGVDHLAFNRYIGAPLPSLEATPTQVQCALREIMALKAAGVPLRLGTPAPQCVLRTNGSPCLAGLAFVTVDPWGKVRPCNHSELVVGDLLEDSVAAVLDSPELQAWYSAVPALCAGCELWEVCGGGCRAECMLRAAPLQGHFVRARESVLLAL